MEMSVERRLSTAELRALFQQFTESISTDARMSRQLTTWSEARDQWRSNWKSRSAVSPALTFQLLIPHPISAGREHWVHPVADQTSELDAWRTVWEKAPSVERGELAAAFVRAVALIESDPASTGDACAQLARTAGRRGFPLAALTPALSSLDPARFVVICDSWLRAINQYDGTEASNDVAAYSETNIRALRWLAAAQGDSLAAVLVGCPPADRFGIFCSWVVRMTADRTRDRAFDVTRKKYKDWPPMW